MLSDADIQALAEEIAQLIVSDKLPYERGEPAALFRKIGAFHSAFTLPWVQGEHARVAVRLKNLLGLWNVLVDDPVDRHQDRTPLDECVRLLSTWRTDRRLPPTVEQPAARVLARFLSMLGELERVNGRDHDAALDAIAFDVGEVLVGVDYEHTFCRLGRATESEYRRYVPMTVTLKVYLDIDWLFHPAPPSWAVYARLREALDRLTCAVKLASDIGSYRRELLEAPSNMVRLRAERAGLPAEQLLPLEGGRGWSEALRRIMEEVKALSRSELAEGEALLRELRDTVATEPLVRAVNWVVEDYSRERDFGWSAAPQAQTGRSTTQEWRRLLGEMGTSDMTASPYDTAWLARLRGVEDGLADAALEWLRAHQLEDGGWGSAHLYHPPERLLSTLAAMIALAERGETQDGPRLSRARKALGVALQRHLEDPTGELIGFELLLPTLAQEAEAVGLSALLPRDMLEGLERRRRAKLSSLPTGSIHRGVTPAFSSEMLGRDMLALLDVERLQEANGSVAYSPAATAFFALRVRPGDADALRFLRDRARDGAVPYITPIENFERGWGLWSLAQLEKVPSELLPLCQPHLDAMEKEWDEKRGISACAWLALVDGDTSGVVYEALTRFGRSVPLSGVLAYEEATHFRCFPLEANPSTSTNVHILGALVRAGLDRHHPSVQKAISYLERAREGRAWWSDKWHISPYYTTSHAIISYLEVARELAVPAVEWLLAMQRPDGSWGHGLPTAEETAYCLQALVLWQRHGGKVPAEVLRRGGAWLEAHSEPPYPPLWIGKSLYSPNLAVRGAVLGARMMLEELS